ncbi:MAG: hypothetical protein MUF59_08060 [Candidatus Krumholzibacteria bacterium]|nr:hypothetical protein [Candidatus Krumholzibacteria bacterium]
MKKLSMVALFLLLPATVFAHGGSVGLYTSQAATDCDAFVPPGTPTSIYLMYYKSDGGPDGISGVEFMIEKTSAMVLFLTPTWNPQTIQNGDLATGIGVAFTAECFGAGQSLIWIGTIQVMDIGGIPGWILKVVGDPRSLEGNGLNVSRCDYDKTMAPVLGGWFVASEGGCNVSNDGRSWGAIKSLYSE